MIRVTHLMIERRNFVTHANCAIGSCKNSNHQFCFLFVKEEKINNKKLKIDKKNMMSVFFVSEISLILFTGSIDPLCCVLLIAEVSTESIQSFKDEDHEKLKLS